MNEDPPIASPDDITPEIRSLSLRLLGLADTGQLTLGHLERALVAFARSMRKDEAA